jgi:hypothetical protein
MKTEDPATRQLDIIILFLLETLHTLNHFSLFVGTLYLVHNPFSWRTIGHCVRPLDILKLTVRCNCMSLAIFGILWRIHDFGATARSDEMLSLCDPSWQYCHHIPPLRQWTEEAMFRRSRLIKRN